MAIWPASAMEELTAISAARFTKPKDPRAMFMLLASLSPDPSHTVSDDLLDYISCPLLNFDKPCVILNPFFNGPEAEGREHFKDFFSVGGWHSI